MTTAAHVPSDVETYLARVRAALADVPAEERNDLLAEVEASLHETASETGGSVAAQLGPPEDFAAELRSAAGLHPSSEARGTGLRDTIGRLAGDPRVAESIRYLRELAPIWWAVRGYAAVAGLALIAGASWSTAQGAVPRIGSAKVGAAVICLAVIASAALGLWSRRRPFARLPLAFVNVLLVAAAIATAVHLSHPAPQLVSTEIVVQTAPVPGLAYNGAPVTNIYPYSRDGRPLYDVLLYGPDGSPLDVGNAVNDPNRRILVTKSRRLLFNAFPLRYYEPGTKVVLRPKLAPRVRVPTIATPSLQTTTRR